MIIRLVPSVSVPLCQCKAPSWALIFFIWIFLASGSPKSFSEILRQVNSGQILAPQHHLLGIGAKQFQCQFSAVSVSIQYQLGYLFKFTPFQVTRQEHWLFVCLWCRSRFRAHNNSLMCQSGRLRCAIQYTFFIVAQKSLYNVASTYFQVPTVPRAMALYFGSLLISSICECELLIHTTNHSMVWSIQQTIAWPFYHKLISVIIANS